MGDGTRWNTSVTQTKYMLIESPYAAVDEPAAAIREVGWYIGSEPDVGHVGDPYVQIADVADLGDFQGVDRIPIVNRSPATSGKVRFLLTVEN
jgi:hypothetical protein